jgi:hypothetical protein
MMFSAPRFPIHIAVVISLASASVTALTTGQADAQAASYFPAQN